MTMFVHFSGNVCPATYGHVCMLYFLLFFYFLTSTPYHLFSSNGDSLFRNQPASMCVHRSKKTSPSITKAVYTMKRSRNNQSTNDTTLFSRFFLNFSISSVSPGFRTFLFLYSVFKTFYNNIFSFVLSKVHFLYQFSYLVLKYIVLVVK